MPRQIRLCAAGWPLHLIQRGNNRSLCFWAQEDYRVYLHYLRTLAEKFDCAVHAYVLMTNHVHLLLTPQTADAASMFMKHLGQRYTQFVNRKYDRSGTLWDGRFRSSIVQDREYLLACSRYIEMNPVRARIASAPAEYRWSSHPVNVGAARITWLTPHAEYLALGQDARSRAAAYQALFQSPVVPAELDAIRATVRRGLVLGAGRANLSTGV